jgi:hypothetical protein
MSEFVGIGDAGRPRVGPAATAAKYSTHFEQCGFAPSAMTTPKTALEG